MVFVQLLKSDVKDKRYKIIFYDENRKKIKTVNFGYDKGSAYIDHNDDIKKNAWIARHKVRGTFDDYKTPSSLSKWILWNKPTISASYNDYIKKFGLKKY